LSYPESSWLSKLVLGKDVRQVLTCVVTRTMGAVFRKSGVPGAHAHRFRHTLATEILEAGGTFEDAAEILGNSSAII